MGVEHLVTWLRAAMDHVEQVAKNAIRCAYPYDREPPTGRWYATDGGRVADENGETVTFNEGAPTEQQRVHIALNDPRSVLARVEADRIILAEITSWKHTYHDDDPWYSCAQAASTWEDDRSPGSGCSDEDRSGGPCDCGLDRRRDVIVGALLSAYRHVPVPGFQKEWMTGA